jgi:prevent-host-death family protein
MKEMTISVTEAARNFSDCVNRARYQGVTFVLVKNGVPVAQLAPADKKACTGRDLGNALANVELSVEEAVSWRNDLQSAKKKIRSPRRR